MVPGEEEAHERDTPAERRARRAWLGDAVLLRRAEAAEASVRSFESILAERELELRRVKQREHAEQRLRVEAEEATARLRRSHHTELERVQRRAEEARAAARRGEEQRAQLAAQLAEVGESCIRLQRGVGTLQHVAVELRATLDRDQRTALTRIRELEGKLARATAPGDPAASRPIPNGDPQREELGDALAAAVQRLRTRASAPVAPPDPPPATVKPPVVYVVPRLFAAPAGERPGLGRRLAPAVHRVAAKLATWADRAQLDGR